MEEAKALQQQLLLQQQQQQQQQQQFLLLQQLQKQQQQHQAQQAAAISRFPSNIDAHLRPIRPINLQQNPNPNPNSNPNPIPNTHQNPDPNPNSNHNPIPNTHQNPNPNPNSNHNPIPNTQQNPISNHHQQQPQHSQQSQQPQQQQQQQQQQQKVIRPGNQIELQMAYQDAWRVCHPDFKRPFSSLEDACERLLPYHVVADYEAEEDDRILDSDTTGQMLSRAQQWDNNIAAKVSEFIATFEKQALAFNIISRKRAMGEFRSEERLMIEQALLQEERRSMMELKAELASREKAGRELRMAAMVQAEQSWDDSHSHAEMMARAPIRDSAVGFQGSDIASGHDMVEQGQGGDPGEMINGWENNMQRDEKEPSEDFLNDEATENGDTGTKDGWREAGEFDLNAK